MFFAGDNESKKSGVAEWELEEIRVYLRNECEDRLGVRGSKAGR
jgi:hypothetical protein